MLLRLILSLCHHEKDYVMYIIPYIIRSRSRWFKKSSNSVNILSFYSLFATLKRSNFEKISEDSYLKGLTGHWMKGFY